jgi:hypothetical protein
MSELKSKDYEIYVRFGPAFTNAQQGQIMLEMEKWLRATYSLPLEVYKDTMGDDSKLRARMTPEQRNKL